MLFKQILKRRTTSLVINNAKINNKTDAVAENVLKHKKVDKSTLNQPIIDYITRTCQINADLEWYFLDELLKIDNTKLLQDLSISNRGGATLSSLRETS